MTAQHVGRFCGHCGKRLSRYNRDKRCQACSSLIRDDRNWRDQPGEHAASVYSWNSIFVSGKRMAESRRRIGLTQQVLADRAGISHSLVQKLESVPRRATTIGTLMDIASVLKVPVGILIDPSLKKPLEEFLSAVGGESESAGVSR